MFVILLNTAVLISFSQVSVVVAQNCIDYNDYMHWIGRLDTLDFAYGVSHSGNNVFVASWFFGLYVIDKSDPVNPQVIGSINTPLYATDVVISGTYAYVTDYWTGLHVIDIADRENPQHVCNVDTPGNAYRLVISEAYAYVADGPSGLQVIDVANPESPQLVGSVDTPGCAYAVAHSGSTVCVADGYSGLQIVDVAIPEAPLLVSGTATMAEAYDVAIADNYAYIANSDWGVYQIDISDPANPEIASNINMPSCIRVIEGTVSRCYLAFQRDVVGGNQQIRMVSSPLNLEDADFDTEVTVLAQTGVDFANPRFTSSLADYNWFYLFLVAEGDGPAGGDIWFARSTDLGDSFEAGYALSTLANGATNRYPDIAYGIGSNLHVTWYYESDDNNFEDAIRYRRGEHGANEGPSEWGLTQVRTTTSSGYYENVPRIAASTTTDEVVIVYTRWLFQPPHAYVAQDPAVQVSGDRGVSFGSETQFNGPFTTGGIEENPISGQWVIGGSRWRTGINTADSGDLENWSDFLEMGDENPGLTFERAPSLALNPHKGRRAAILWNWKADDGTEDPDQLMFDGHWRGDPGYPNFADGFPIPLAAPPLSPPALVDVNGDDNLEIVFSAEDHLVHVKDANGDDLPGWPVQVGQELSDGPVAVGDLQNDGQMTVVVGTAQGWVYAYDAAGQLRTGWPQYLETDDPAYVSIGATGVGVPRTVVVCCGPRIRLYNQAGQVPPNGIGWVMNPHTFTSPAAIGDIDGDGIAEVVGSIGHRLFAYQFAPPHITEFFLDMVDEATGAVTLADLDQDGDADILYPAHGGTLHALGDDGTSLGGNWPFDFTLSNVPTSAVVGRMDSMSHPVIGIASGAHQITLLNDDGSERAGYPVDFGPFFNFGGAPIIGAVEGVIPEMLIGSTNFRLYAFDHEGNHSFGWPKVLDYSVRLSPAIGDIDDDGGNEVVVLTDNMLTVLDVLTAPGDPARMWPMYGHDAQRTGCADCIEDLITPVRESPVGTTGVMFAGAAPNPFQGPSVFHFAVPRDARIDLSVYDLKGRKVASVRHGTVETGEHFVTWNGRDDAGRRTPSGNYLATLRVIDGAGQQVLTRKITILQ